MFDREDPKIIWVGPQGEGGTGTYADPFTSLGQALQNVKPGNTVVLKDGTYYNDQTIEISGSAELPVKICADTDAEVVIDGACWFFYDTSDLVVTDLIFTNAPQGAISVIGNCQRNLFSSLKFLDCGIADKPSCTVYFGGAGARFNMVENCHFQRNQLREDPAKSTIALMVAEGDDEFALPIKNHIFRRNTFINYSYGVMIGSSDQSDLNSGHIVEYNRIENCSIDGIMVKVGDAQVRGNLIKGCMRNPVSVSTGEGTVVEDNRVVDCKKGVQVNGDGHTVVNNCFIRCAEEAVNVGSSSGTLRKAASNLFINSNTCVHCGIDAPDKQEAVSGFRIEPGTSCIIQKNLVVGDGKPYGIVGENGDSTVNYVVDDNICDNSGVSLHGFEHSSVSFDQPDDDNYQNSSGYGACGLMLTPQTFDPSIDELREGEVDYLAASVLEDEQGGLVIPGGDDENPFTEIYSGLLQDNGPEDETVDDGTVNEDD
ncbi:chondroitinase-B domain-containing protein [Chitinispirillales bacterium ANBcel5]|uniref:right-handed parallel beta-helix repeat-containing protein n=1 Tax=Cellulosispirillum alkaliphilum TaxID=3039283 RepID=UPI002A536E0D|nr:chondroitinase-B domain-containing protein [Chitinispirillales bacterium ANBcel5]